MIKFDKEGQPIIIGKRGYPLKQCDNGNGYLTVHYEGKTRYVHRLIAEKFIPNPDTKPQINHIDGDKQNNAISNLEWVTQAENIQHAFKTGLNKGHSQTPVQATPINGCVGLWFPSTTAAERLGFDHSHISKCVLGRNRKHKGYKWSKA